MGTEVGHLTANFFCSSGVLVVLLAASLQDAHRTGTPPGSEFSSGNGIDLTKSMFGAGSS
jgi:hypothetical protein